jgi:enoyl-CoA hydratase/carnithine racemase
MCPRTRTRLRNAGVDLDDHVLLIGVNRPDKRNAFDLAALEQLSAAYQRLGEDAQARVGVLYAHGAHFSAGLDLGEVGPVVAERGPEALKGSGRYDPFGLWTEQVPKAGGHGRAGRRLHAGD